MTTTTQPTNVRFPSIHARLLFLVLAVMFPLIGLIGFGAREVIARERLSAQERAQARARFTVARIDMELSNTDTLLQTLSKVVSLDAAEGEKNARLFASVERELPPFYLKLEVHPPTEELLATAGSPPRSAELKALRDAVTRRAFVVGDLARSATTGRWTVLLARPILNSAGEPAGVISIAIEVERMSVLLNTDDLPERSLISVIAPSNTNLARSREPELIGTPTVDRKVIGAAILAREGSVEFLTTNGTLRLAGYATCQRAPWLVFVRISTSAAFATVDRQLRVIFGLVSAVLAASLVLAWFLADRIARPIRTLATEATAFGDGASIQPSKVDAGGEIGVLARAFNRMVNAVAQRDAALRESEQRYRTLIEGTPDGVAVHRDGKILYVNPAAVAMLGARQPGDLLGTDPFSRVHPASRPLARARAQELIASDRGLPAIEIKLLRIDGTEIEVESQSLRIIFGGKPAVLGIARDISHRRRAEAALREADQRFRDLVDCTDAIVWEADAATFAFASVSNNAERILGYPVAEWLQPEFWLSHVHVEDRAQTASQRLAGSRKRKEFELEYRFHAKDGRTVWLRDDVKVIDEAGKPRWLRGLMIDITETRELERQLRQSQKLEAIGTLASGIAHDFNNILTGIFGFTALARASTVANSELSHYLDEIMRSGQRAAELVRQILAFGRTRGGDAELTPVQLGPVVTEGVKLLRATSPSTAEFVTSFSTRLPPVHGNATQLHQIVINLGTNAVHALRNRPGRVSFELTTWEADEALERLLPGSKSKSFLRLAVSDTGIGMDLATRERVFEPFFTTKAPGLGTGLGLSVVHGIVRHHHGAIRIESRLEQGTIIEIFLPVSTSESLPSNHAAPARIGRGHGERILIVDDEEIIAHSTKLLLREHGFEAESELHGADALARLERDPQAFQLVLSDQSMPGLTGLELAQRIRALRADLPVVLASGHSAALTPENIRAAGVREVLDKPYTMEILVAVLNRNLSGNTPPRPDPLRPDLPRPFPLTPTLCD